MSAFGVGVPGMTKQPFGPVRGGRALDRATLGRQLLPRRSPRSAAEAVAHLVGLRAQSVKPPCYALAARLDGFVPEQLSQPMTDREVVRTVTLRSTLHTHTAADALTPRPLVQPAPARAARPDPGADRLP